MNCVIKFQFRTLWDQPIYVVDRNNRDMMIKGPREALRYLLDDIVAQSGDTYRNALSTCSAAINNPAYVDRAHDAFLAAYREQRSRLPPSLS